LAEEQDDNPRPSKAFYIVRQDKWGGEGPPAVLVLSATCYSSFSARLAKGASCYSKRSSGNSHSLTTLVLPYLRCRPATGGGHRVCGWYGVKEAVVPQGGVVEDGGWTSAVGHD